VAQSTKQKSTPGKKNNPSELTEDQKQEIREAFDLFDTDGSGQSVAEFSLLCEHIVRSCLAINTQDHVFALYRLIFLN